MIDNPSMGEWRTLDTFPVDKPTIQLIGPATCGSDTHLEYYQRVVANPAGLIHHKITHWMPLPDEATAVHDGHDPNA